MRQPASNIRTLSCVREVRTAPYVPLSALKPQGAVPLKRERTAHVGITIDAHMRVGTIGATAAGATLKVLASCHSVRGRCVR